MTAPQIITSPTGERLVVLPEAEYQILLTAAEDASDVDAVRTHRLRRASSEEEMLPVEMVKRLLAGESPVRVWREHRGLRGNALADSAGISATYLSEIETGKKDGSLAAMKKIADALGITLDDIAP